MGISKHFGRESYEWKLDIVENLREFSQYLLYDFFGSAIIPILRTSIYIYIYIYIYIHYTYLIWFDNIYIIYNMYIWYIYIYMFDTAWYSCMHLMMGIRKYFLTFLWLVSKLKKNWKVHLVRLQLPDLNEVGRSKPCGGKRHPCHLCGNMKDTCTFKSKHLNEVHKINKK